MDHGEIKIGGEYVWRPAGGQRLRVIATEAPKPVLTGVGPDDVVWICKAKLLDSPVARPDSSIDVSELHEK